MRENDYSQVIIHTDSEYRVLTREAISKWFESKIENNHELCIDLDKILVDSILKFETSNFSYISRASTALELLSAFHSSPSDSQPVVAVLVTEKGKKNEIPLRIFTPWDISEIHKQIEI